MENDSCATRSITVKKWILKVMRIFNSKCGPFQLFSILSDTENTTKDDAVPVSIHFRIRMTLAETSHHSFLMKSTHSRFPYGGIVSEERTEGRKERERVRRGKRRWQENHQTLMIVIMMIMKWWKERNMIPPMEMETHRRHTFLSPHFLSLPLSLSLSPIQKSKYWFCVKRIDNGSKLCHSYSNVFSKASSRSSLSLSYYSQTIQLRVPWERRVSGIDWQRTKNGKENSVSVLNYNLSLNCPLNWIRITNWIAILFYKH